jgi:hypothetical protein
MTLTQDNKTSTTLTQESRTAVGTLTQDDKTSTVLTQEDRTAVGTLTQDSKQYSGISWGSNLLTWAQETHTWANSIGTLTLDSRT